MAKLTFVGGIHPYDGKDLSKDKPIQDVLPKGEMVYPLSQHIGAPAKPIVAKGDRVLAGQKIAESGGFVSAPIYASVSGTVKTIETRRVVTGDLIQSIVIDNDGLYESEEFHPYAPVDKLQKEEIIDIVKEAGITGMGDPWFCKYLCPSGTLFGGIPLLAANPTLRAAAGLLFDWKMLVLLAVVVLSIKFYRPFCKYLCPLGAIYGLFNPIALYRYRVQESACVHCGSCQQACGMDIPVWEKPNSIECIRCGKCKAACPTGAIHSTAEGLRVKPYAGLEQEKTEE